jgi:hypothetical protein
VAGRGRWHAVVCGDRATTVSLRVHGHELARTRDHGPSWAASK